MKRKLLVCLLCVLMVAAMMPTMAFAAVPASAVAYVTDAERQPVGEGDDDLGDGYYKTLKAAINACPDSVKTTITMMKDEIYASNMGANVPAGKNIILDLAGHKIATYEPTANTTYTIQNAGTLTITDSSATLDENGYQTEPGTGKIACYSESEMQDHADIPGYATNTIRNIGDLTVNAGTFINQTIDTKGEGLACYVIDNDAQNAGKSISLTFNGGEMQNEGKSPGIRVYLSTKENQKNVFHANGGLLTSVWIQEGGYNRTTKSYFPTNNNCEVILKNCDFKNSGGLGWYTQSSGTTVKIENVRFGTTVEWTMGKYTDNTFTVDNLKAQSFYMADAGKVLGEGCYFMKPVLPKYIKDGWYCIKNTDEVYDRNGNQYKYKISRTGDPISEEEYYKENPDAVAVVKDSDGNIDEFYTSLLDAIKAAKSGQAVLLLKDTTWTDSTSYFLQEKITVDLGGHKIDDTSSYGFIVDNDNYYKYDDFNVTFKNGTLNTTNYGFYLYSETSNVTMENLTINAAKYAAYYTKPNCDVTLNNVSINGNGNSAIYSNPGGEVTLTLKGTNNIVTTGADGFTLQKGHLTIDALAGSDTTISATSQGCDGIFGYDGFAITGTGKMNVTGANAAVHLYDYFSAVDKGLDITNPNAVFNAFNNDSYAVQVGHYSTSSGYYGNNTSVNITGGTFNGPVDVESIFGNKESSISGGTFNGEVKFDDYYYDLTVSGGKFNKKVVIWQECAGYNAAIIDGVFKNNVAVWDYSGANYANYGGSYGPAENGRNLSITGGVFEGVVTADYSNATDYSKTGSADCISGGIYKIEPNHDYAAENYAIIENPDDKTKSKYGWTVGHEVIFDSDGGSQVAPQGIMHGKLALKPNNPTKNGFVFAGWFNTDESQFLFDSTPITRNITLKANWLKEESQGQIIVEKKDNPTIESTAKIEKSAIPLTTHEVDTIKESVQNDVKVVLDVEKVVTPKKDGDAEIIQKTVKDNGLKHGAYLDITMVKAIYIDDVEQADSKTNVRETLTPIQITIVIPEIIRAEGRVYSIIRCHEGKSEIIFQGKANDKWELTFETDKFSAYEIAYTEAPQGGGIATGDSNGIVNYTLIGLMALMGMALALTLKKRFNR